MLFSYELQFHLVLNILFVLSLLNIYDTCKCILYPHVCMSIHTFLLLTHFVRLPPELQAIAVYLLLLP